jgi:glycerol uptake operon antiterminator
VLISKIIACLEDSPVIAAVSDDKWTEAIACPSQVIFYLSADLLTVEEKVRQAHEAGKYVLVHIDLADGIGKDRTGVRFLAQCGVDGIISTKSQLIRLAKEQGLLTVQRFFALDSKGVDSIGDMLRGTNPHLMEIMPGLVPKIIRRYADCGLPVIAGGLIQTKTEVTDALGAGATAVSTGQLELCYL